MTDLRKLKLFDSAGNPVTVTGTSLNVDVTNTIDVAMADRSVNLFDSVGNPITVTGTSLNVVVTNTVPVTMADRDVNVTNTVPVTMADRTVTGPLTDAELRATEVPITMADRDVKLKNEDDTYVNAVNPMPSNIDSVYLQDVDITHSDNGTFSGGIADYFNDLFSVQSDVSATNPKTIKIWFKHSIQLWSLGFGCNESGKNFSNIKIKLFGSDEFIRETVDDSANNEKFTSKTYDFASSKANGVILEFHTTDEVCLSNLIIWKATNVNAQLIAANENTGFAVPITASPNNNLNVAIAESGGVPQQYSKMTENALRSSITKGQLNKIKMFPQILNEQVESSREIQGTVTASNIVGQIFRASKDNITSLGLTLESAAGVVVDDFESYADSAAVQAVWQESGNVATKETILTATGAAAMYLPGTGLGDEWIKTGAPIDYTNYTGEVDVYFGKEYNKFKVAIFIGDGTNTKSLDLTFGAKDLWYHFEIAEPAMIEDQAGITNILAITEIGFRIWDADIAGYAVIDDLTATPPPGNLGIKLFDMGATIPVDGVTTIASGTPYTQIGAAQTALLSHSLIGGKRLYNIHEFYAGRDVAVPTNELLTIDNYYMVTLNYMDTNVAAYGPNTSYSYNYYNSGFAFTTPNEATAITAIGPYSDLQFLIFSRQDCYVLEAEAKFDNSPGENADISIYMEDPNMKISRVVVPHEEAPERITKEDISARPAFLADGGKIEFYYNDDFSDDVAKVTTEYQFMYIDNDDTTHG
jgi:hypothetical protein